MEHLINGEDAGADNNYDPALQRQKGKVGSTRRTAKYQSQEGYICEAPTQEVKVGKERGFEQLDLLC